MLSFAIGVHNEREYLRNQINFIFEHARNNYDFEIILVDDYSDDELTKEILESLKIEPEVKFYQRYLNGDFSGQKNWANSKCSGDFIFNLDPDEMPPQYLIENFENIVTMNDVDLIWIPRINIVEGITSAHVQTWGWRVNEHGWVNWPDFQSRIYKNDSEIKWVNPVHERIVGYKKVTNLPPEEMFALTHYKTIDRQEAQNRQYYEIHTKNK